MSEAVRLADYAIWGVALLLYAYDAARRFGPRDILLVEAGGAGLAPSLNESPFTARPRALAFAPLHLPHRGLFVATWGRPWIDAAGLGTALGELARFRALLTPARVLATLAFVLLFVVGPVLTALLGPDAAVVYTAAGVYPTALAAAIWLWWRRRAFALGPGRTALLTVELVVCPAFLPNLVRKLTVPYPIDVDGAQLALAAAGAEGRADLLMQLDRRMQVLLDEDGAADGVDRAQLDAYLATLRAAR